MSSAPIGPGIDDAARALLAWYAAMGVDEAIGETPTDWATMQRAPAPSPQQAAQAAGATSSASAPRAPARPGTPPLPDRDVPPDEFDAPAAQPRRADVPRPVTPAPALRRPPALPADEAVMAAREQARSARTLEELRTLLAGFEGCGLKATAKSLCFYRGAPHARVMLIGEAPGRDEDLEGKPFVGRAGQLLDKMLAAIGLDEGDVHITNIVYWRPPGNRTPTPQEAQVCQPFVERQIELVAPGLVVLLGGAAAKQVLDTPEGIMRLRGQWRELEVAGRRIPAMATLHPAYLLRTPAAKRMAWRDLMAIHDRLQGGNDAAQAGRERA